MQDRGAEAETMVWLAVTLVMQGRVSEGDALMDQALALADSSASRISQAHVRGLYGMHIGLTRSAREGLDLISQAIRLLDELGDTRMMAEVTLNAGALARWTGDLDASMRWFSRALDLLEAVEHRGFLPEAERGLAETLLETGDLVGAAAHAERAVELTLPNDNLTIAATRMVLGRVRAVQGRDDEARRLLLQSIEMQRNTFLTTQWEGYLAMSEFCMARGLFAEGESWLAKSLATIAPLGGQAPMLDEVNRRIQRARASTGAVSPQPT